VRVDSLQAKVRGTGVIGSEPAAVSGEGEQTVQFSLAKIDTHEDHQGLQFATETENTVLLFLLTAFSQKLTVGSDSRVVQPQVNPDHCIR
jgi:hypothetical protein